MPLITVELARVLRTYENSTLWLISVVMCNTKGKPFSQYVDLFLRWFANSGCVLRNFRKKTIRSNFCPGHVECSFNNPAEIFLHKVQKILAGNPKNVKYSWDKFKITWTRRMQFWQYRILHRSRNKNKEKSQRC